MLISAFILLLFANVVNHSIKIKDDLKKAFLFIVYILFILVFGFRGADVPDTKYYIASYYNLPNSVEFEYLYRSMTHFANSIGLSFNGFLIIYQIILFFLWFYASSKYLDDVHLAFLVFVSFMGCFYFGIIIRAAMGLCLCYVAIIFLISNKTFKGYIIYFTLVTVAVFFQKSMIVFYIIPLFVFKKFNSIVLISILTISILLPLFNLQHFIAKILETYVILFSSEKLLTYTRFHADFNISGLYSLTMIKYWVLAWIFIWLRPRLTAKEEIYNIFLNIYISGVFLITMTYFISAGNRLAYIFFFFEFFLVSLIYENSNIPKKIVLFCAIALSIINYVNLISANPSMIMY